MRKCESTTVMPIAMSFSPKPLFGLSILMWGDLQGAAASAKSLSIRPLFSSSKKFGLSKSLCWYN